MTYYYSNFHHSTGGRYVADALEFGFVSHGWGKSAFDAMKRVRAGDELFVRNTGKDAKPWVAPGFFGRALVLADPVPSEEAEVLVDGSWKAFLECDLRGNYKSTGPYPELVAPVEWTAQVPFDSRFNLRREDGGLIAYRQSTMKYDLDNPKYAEELALLDEALPFSGAKAAHKEPSDGGPGAHLIGGFSGPPDPAIEEAGMLAVEKWFEDLDARWSTERVHRLNLGWDIEARRGKKRLLIEVKATRLPIPTIRISTNELDHGPTEGDWRLAVVTNATLPNQSPVMWFSAGQAKGLAVATDYRCEMDAADAAKSPFDL